VGPSFQAVEDTSITTTERDVSGNLEVDMIQTSFKQYLWSQKWPREFSVDFDSVCGNATG